MLQKCAKTRTTHTTHSFPLPCTTKQQRDQYLMLGPIALQRLITSHATVLLLVYLTLILSLTNINIKWPRVFMVRTSIHCTLYPKHRAVCANGDSTSFMLHFSNQWPLYNNRLIIHPPTLESPTQDDSQLVGSSQGEGVSLRDTSTDAQLGGAGDRTGNLPRFPTNQCCTS